MPKTARYAWILVALLWLVWLLNYLDRQVVFVLFPLLKTDLALSDLQLGLLGTSFLWVYAFASPFSGYAADRWGRKRIIVASLLVWSLSHLAHRPRAQSAGTAPDPRPDGN